jgi:hypothetical protein
MGDQELAHLRCVPCWLPGFPRLLLCWPGTLPGGFKVQGSVSHASIHKCFAAVVMQIDCNGSMLITQHTWSKPPFPACKHAQQAQSKMT